VRAKSAKGKAAAKPATIDDYLAPLDGDQRGALEKLRKTIRAAAPGAEECISYGMPGFRHDGRMLVWFGAAAGHCAFYPGGVVKAYEKELKDFETSKGTIRLDRKSTRLNSSHNVISRMPSSA